MTFGHCGIDWMHSLIDSHKQILIIPALSFYRCWKMLNARSASSANEMFDIWYSYITKYIGPNSSNKQKQILHNDKEMDVFFTEFQKHLDLEGFDKISVFWALHSSYAHAKGINTSKIKSIVVHEHLPWPFEEVLADFENVNFMIMMRDPRAAIAGVIKGRVSDFGYLPDFTFNSIFEAWLQGNDINNKYSKALGNRLKIVKNEDLHESLEKNMREISDWLKVDFNKSMLVPTNSSGVIRIPDSRYLDGHQESIDDAVFFSPQNVRKRWLTVLKNPKDILMIEAIFSDLMEQFGYKRISAFSYFSYLKGIIFFIFPNHSIVNKWLDDYPNLEEFSRINNRLKRTYWQKIWIRTPSCLKLILLYLFSTFRRIKIFFFPGDRWKRYDSDIANL
tara:strand:- start:89 stop:1261 length:1173 start_codon:yes stop_codon:yes gene_type:complete